MALTAAFSEPRAASSWAPMARTTAGWSARYLPLASTWATSRSRSSGARATPVQLSWHWFCRYRQGKEEARTLPQFAFGPDAPTVQFDQGAGDAQSQAGAANAARIGIINPVEPFPDPRQFFGRDADPLIVYGHQHKAPRRMVAGQVATPGLAHARA